VLAKDWNRSIAAVIDVEGNVRGTAFFIGLDVAITCYHVLVAAGTGAALKPVGSEVTEQIIETESDEELDLALIRVVSHSARNTLFFDSLPMSVGRDIYSHGFPRDHGIGKYPNGFPMDPARVSGNTDLTWRGQPVQLIVLANADVQQGMSGAPAIDLETQSIVGVLRFSESHNKRALAIPAEVVTRRWPAVLSENRKRTYGDLVDTIPDAFAHSAWKEFDPTSLHCLVVMSERAETEGPSESLDELFRDLMSGPSALIVWEKFREAYNGRRLISGTDGRSLSISYNNDSVNIASLSVLDVFENMSSVDIAGRLIVEADLAIFDVTGFEPGVMFLLGVRAATRRGVTIVSHGGGWMEGEPLLRPFNLSDLSVASHTAFDKSLVGQDPRIGRLMERICNGFEQCLRHPYYRDLPVYDALRQLGPREDARKTIPLEDEVLVLCSYDATYFRNWLNLRRRLKAALHEAGISTSVVRLQDVPTPQLVSQSLYERIRRCAGCVADWTGSSPSTFFELGVRVAVSPWSVVQIASASWISEIASDDGSSETPKKQISLMLRLLEPILYKGDHDPSIGQLVAQRLINLRASASGSQGHGLRRVAARALSRLEERVPDVVQQLRDEADALNHPDRVRENVPQALYYEIASIKVDQERAALERRLAAWLYLDQRVGAGALQEDDPKRILWLETGQLVAADLFESASDADQMLALKITEKLT
jgi:hypothetical protein